MWLVCVQLQQGLGSTTAAITLYFRGADFTATVAAVACLCRYFKMYEVSRPGCTCRTTRLKRPFGACSVVSATERYKQSLQRVYALGDSGSVHSLVL